MAIGDRLRHAWNAFTNNNDPLHERPLEGDSYGGAAMAIGGGRPDRPRPIFSNERSIISSIYSQLAIDVSAVPMRHCRVDDDDRYEEDVDSGLNEIFKVQANMDQAARQFRQDIALTLFERGVCALVPIDTTISPINSGGFDIRTMRVGWITMWHPQHVRVSVYNEKTGNREELTLPKASIAIVENPLYSIMNEPNSTLQRLIRKLNLLDAVDEASASGKLDLIVQLPYVIKSEARRQQAEQRRADIEFQLKGSKYGIAYTDGTEKITQLNRPVENNLMGQIEFLTKMLYDQLGLTDTIMNGTADEKTMLNYYGRTIEPILDAIVEAMVRSFITKTARTQGQTIKYFRDPFKFMPLGGDDGLAKIADVLARNEIATSNELRQAIGWKPRPEPKADQLINSNMPVKDTGVDPNTGEVIDSTAVEDPEGDAALAEAQKVLEAGP